MYVAGFAVGSWLLTRLAKTGFWPLPKEKVDQYVTALIIGMFLGARTAYVFIYNWDYYSGHVDEIFHVCSQISWCVENFGVLRATHPLGDVGSVVTQNHEDSIRFEGAGCGANHSSALLGG